MGAYIINRPDPAAMERLLEREQDSAAGVILRLAWQAGLTREEISDLTWPQVDLSAGELLLPERTVPLCPDLRDCLAARSARFGGRAPHVVISDRRKERMMPESISRLARAALNSEGMEAVRLMDLRHDFVLRAMETHDWPYVVRVSGMTVSTLQARYARTPREGASLNLGQPRKTEVDEFRLWKLLQSEGSSPAGLALWMSWQMGLQAREILSLTWDQVDFARGEVRLPERTVPLSNAVQRLLQGERLRRSPEDDPHLLLTPNSRRPVDLPRLSRLVRTALIRGGMENVTLRDLRRDESRQSEDTLILSHAAEQGCTSRGQVMDLLSLSRSAAYNRLKSLTDRGKLVRIGEKYYPAGTVIPPEQQPEAICQYLRENGSAYRQDIAGLLHIGDRQCAAVLRRMVQSGQLRQIRQRYFLPETDVLLYDLVH